MRERELELALSESRACGLRLWERADHLIKTMKEIAQLTDDPMISRMAKQALTYKSTTID